MKAEAGIEEDNVSKLKQNLLVYLITRDTPTKIPTVQWVAMYYYSCLHFFTDR